MIRGERGPQLGESTCPSFDKYLFPETYCVGPRRKQARSSVICGKAAVNVVCRWISESPFSCLKFPSSPFLWSPHSPRKHSHCHDNRGEGWGWECDRAQGLWFPNAASYSDSRTARAARARVPCGRSHNCDSEKTGLAPLHKSQGEGDSGQGEAAIKGCVFCLSPPLAKAPAGRHGSFSGLRCCWPRLSWDAC